MMQERPTRVERRLSAILAADVAGYSRLMHDDEEATHARLTSLLADAVDPAIAEHGGRIVKNTGDGFLAEFPSAVEAVRAALQFQNRIHEVAVEDTEERRILFRVGINIGDVIVEPHDICGDDVNIAARLESIAESGGICISSSAYDQVRGKLAVKFADLGEQRFKNIALPIRTYAVVREGSGARTREFAVRSPRSAPHLSIVVLPFSNFGDDPEQDYFVDGVTERLDKPVADLFDMQDEIVSRLARALDTQLVVAEARRAEHSRHPGAVDLVFQGLACIYRGPTHEHLSQAQSFFERALAIDPRNVGALVGMASVDAAMGSYMLTDDRLARLAAAEANAIRALSLDPDQALAHRILGTVFNVTNRAAQAIAECEQALALDRNLAYAHASIGMAKYYLGRAAETEGHINEAFRLSPRDIFAHRWMQFVGVAKIHLGADAEAIAWLRRSVEANRNSPFTHFLLAAALGLQGYMDEARKAAAAALALNPGFTIHRYRTAAPSDNPEFLAGRERQYIGMRLAGVPEG